MADEHYADLPNGEVIWITPEFALMSRGGRRGRGIAAEWLAKYSADVYPHDHVIHDGRKLRPPRYFDKLLEQWDPVALAQIKLQREHRAKELAEDNTPARLADKETVCKAKLALKNTHWSKTMKMHIITLRDLKANVYLPPMYVPNLFAAQREISDVLNGTEKREVWPSIRKTSNYSTPETGHRDKPIRTEGEPTTNLRTNRTGPSPELNH